MQTLSNIIIIFISTNYILADNIALERQYDSQGGGRSIVKYGHPFKNEDSSKIHYFVTTVLIERYDLTPWASFLLK